MRYWAAQEQRVFGKLFWKEGTHQKVPCSPLEWDGSPYFGPQGALWSREKDATGEKGQESGYFCKMLAHEI